MLKFYKCRNVKSPTRAHYNDAGIDFFCPDELTLEEMKAKNLEWGFTLTEYSLERIGNAGDYISSIMLVPHQRVLIPSGIHVSFPKGYALIAQNKSGITAKTGLIVGSSVIDAGYEGEVHLSLINTSNDHVDITVGQKIVQFVLFKLGEDVPEEVGSLEQLYPAKSVRGEGGFGSSGNN